MFDVTTLSVPLIDDILSSAAAADRRGLFGRAVQVLEERGELRQQVRLAVDAAAHRAATDQQAQDLAALADVHAPSLAALKATLLAWSLRELVAYAGVQDEAWRDRTGHLRGDPRVVAVAQQLGASAEEAAQAFIYGPDDDGYFYLRTGPEVSTTAQSLERASALAPMGALAAFQRMGASRAAKPQIAPERPRIPWGGLDFDLDELNGELCEALAAAFPAGGPMHAVKVGARVQAALAAWDEETNGRFEDGTPQAALAQALEALKRAEAALGEADEKLREARRLLALSPN